MMDYYMNELEERLERATKRNQDNVNLVPDDVTLNVESMQPVPSLELANVSNCKSAVMTVRLDSTTTGSGTDCSLVEIVREAVVDEIIVVEEAWNSIIVAVGPNTSQSTASPVAQLLTLARQIIHKVRVRNSNCKSKAYFGNCC